MLLEVFLARGLLMSQSRRFFFRSRPVLASNADDDVASNRPASQNEQQQMGVVSYDEEDTGDIFARDDLPFEKLMGSLSNKKGNDEKAAPSVGNEGAETGVPKLGGKEMSLEERLQEAYERNLNRPREDGWIENPDRPTGYGIPDEDDNEEEMRKQLEEDIEQGTYVPDDSVPNGYMDSFVRLLRDTYIGSPYDSRKKQQARYVIRNITGISVGIGIVFTAVWYLSPVKFISTAKDRDFTAIYKDAEYYRAPSGLMNDDLKSSNVYIDAGAPSGPQTRFDGMDRPSPRLAPKPQVDL